MATERQLKTVSKGLLALAAIWAVLQFVLSFFVHIAERGHASPTGWVAPTPRTYMQAYGLSEIVITVAMLLLVWVVALSLRARARRGDSGAGLVAWSASLVTTALWTVGFAYALGVGICLLLACASVHQSARARGSLSSSPTAVGS